MSWEDQGRQYHMWFGSGHAPVKLKPIAEKDGSTTQDGLEERLRAVVHGAIAALPRKLRPRVESQFQAGTVEKLTEAMAAWIDGSKMDAASFAHHFFDRAADDRAVVSLRAAALETVDAETRPQLAAASGHLATAIQAVGVDGWPRFVADAVKRAHDKATLAAIQKSRQPVVTVSATVGPSGSGSVGSGTRLAAGGENDPFLTPMEGGGEVMPHGGGAMPDIGPPAQGGDPGPPSVVEPLPLPSAPAEAPAAKPAPSPGAAETTAKPGAATRLAPPSVPSGMTRNAFGDDLMQWGSGAAAAASRASTLTSKDVQAMIDRGLTKDMAQAWLDFYNSAASFGRGGEVASARAKLMQTILDHWPK